MNKFYKYNKEITGNESVILFQYPSFPQVNKYHEPTFSYDNLSRISSLGKITFLKKNADSKNVLGKSRKYFTYCYWLTWPLTVSCRLKKVVVSCVLPTQGLVSSGGPTATLGTDVSWLPTQSFGTACQLILCIWTSAINSLSGC